MKLLADLSWKEAGEYLERDDRVILPIGAVEEHGPHLGLGTDCIEAEAMAHRISEATGVVAAPTLNYGLTLMTMGFPGNLSLSPKTLICVVEDILRSMHTHGFKRVLIVNGHGGNTAAIRCAAEALAIDLPDLSLKLVEWWKEAEVNQVIMDTMSVKGTHASFSETALMLHIRPGAVKMDNLTGRDAPLSDSREMLTARTFPKLYPDGIMGLHPGTATAEAGEAVLNKAVEICVGELNNWSTGD
ncbi:MAG: creatininase family protein [Calditrichaeota bacterium]|nr:creatininase family protein [Calditrichota bacterium]